MCGLSARGTAGERQQGNVAGALDGDRYRTLVSRAGAQLASGLNLATLADMAAKAGEILVINVTDVIGAVLAYLTATREAATTAATWASGTTAGAAWATAALTTWAAAALTAAIATWATAALATALGTAEAAGAAFSIFAVL